MLMKEWGISYNDFMDTPNEIIERLFEYEVAVAEGQRRKTNKDKHSAKFAKYKNNLK